MSLSPDRPPSAYQSGAIVSIAVPHREACFKKFIGLCSGRGVVSISLLRCGGLGCCPGPSTAPADDGVAPRRRKDPCRTRLAVFHRPANASPGAKCVSFASECGCNAGRRPERACPGTHKEREPGSHADPGSRDLRRIIDASPWGRSVDPQTIHVSYWMTGGGFPFVTGGRGPGTGVKGIP